MVSCDDMSSMACKMDSANTLHLVSRRTLIFHSSSDSSLVNPADSARMLNCVNDRAAHQHTHPHDHTHSGWRGLSNTKEGTPGRQDNLPGTLLQRRQPRATNQVGHELGAHR